MNKTLGLLGLAIVLLTAGCSTTYYTLPSDYKSFRSDDMLASSSQNVAIHKEDNELFTTYDDEFFYDEDGNLVRHVQTEYFDFTSKDGPKFHEWEVSYTKMGERMVPKSLAVNGVVYAEVEYEMLPVEAEGMVVPQGPDPYFVEVTTDNFIPGAIANVDRFKPSVTDFSIGFPDDGEFVDEVEVFSTYSGFDEYSVLTHGFENIVLTRLYYSYEKVVEGIALTDIGPRAQTENLKKMTRGNTVEYLYDWEVIAEKICMVSHTYDLDLQYEELTFTADVEYDSSGRRISEEWSLTNPDMEEKDEEPVVIFSQELMY